MNKLIWTVLGILILSSCCGNDRQVQDFNFGWKFELSDSREYVEPEFNDSSWRDLHLPHDWAIEGEFSKDNPSTANGGALPGGVAWYRKHFGTPDAERVFVEFDGVFMNSSVWVNGKLLGTRPYGYSSFSYEITDYLDRDSDNVIAVRCDNADQPNSRWYGGCGIYRDTRLVCVNDVHVSYNGVFVTTPGITEESATVHAQAMIEGNPKTAPRFDILDASGKRVASSKAVKRDSVWVADMEVRDPLLWDIDNTNLYTVRVVVPGCDQYKQRFGIRSIRWDADNGFFLNGEHLMLQGVCLHHDMGCIGTAVHRRALERQLQILKSMGCNAIRTSHNPPSPVLLDLCDEMGFVVIDEAMDMWRKRKTRFDYARFFDLWHERDIRDFMQRDRNHPCIVLWSIGNEILEQWNSDDDNTENLTPEQANTLINFMSSPPQYESPEENYNSLLTRHVVDIARDMDTTRMISAGLSETTPSNNLIRSASLDVYGFNYHCYHYDSLKVWYPDIPMFGSETASGLMSRGWYPQPTDVELVQPEVWWKVFETEHHQCSSYDVTHAPWSELHEYAWYMIKEHSFMAGCFVWTGFDYLGEPTPYQWPSRSSYFGVVDLAGFPKDIYWMYQSEWCPGKTVLHLFPHWNWAPGDKVDMWCYYNNADSVELFVNGKSYGLSAKEGSRLHAWWQQVPWEAGTVEAVSYLNGVEIARQSISTTGVPVALKLTPDRNVIAADGYDLSYITVEAVDSCGAVVPDASFDLFFEVSGEGELLGVDNGNAAGILSLKGTSMPLFAGKAIAVVRSVRGQAGKAVLSVSSSIGGESVTIQTK